MWKRRLVWLALILAALCMYLFENNAGTRIILASVLLLPLCSALPLLLSRGRCSAGLEVPEALPRGGQALCRLTLQKDGRVPLPSVHCMLSVRNLRTGERSTLELSGAVGPRQLAAIDFSIVPPHCGKVELAVAELRSVDAFGLFARRLPCETACAFLVMPEVHPMELSLADAADELTDSERYSVQKPGYDPSETFRIREYVPGDPIRQIHWKLTEKTGAVLVRDFGLPLVSDALLLLETSIIHAAAVSLDEMDAALDLFFSVSHSLLSCGVLHTAGWQDGGTGDYESLDIGTEDDLALLRERVLSNPVGTGEMTVAGCYGRCHLQCACAHIAVVSPYAPPDLSLLCHGNRVTVLMPCEDTSKLAGPYQEGRLVPIPAAELAEGALRLEL